MNSAKPGKLGLWTQVAYFQNPGNPGNSWTSNMQEKLVETKHPQ